MSKLREAFGLVRRFLGLLSRRRRRQLAVLALASIVAAVLEMTAIAMIAPFLAVAADPGFVERSGLLSSASAMLGSPDKNMLLILLGVATLVTLLFSNAFLMAFVIGKSRTSAGLSRELSVRLLRGYMHSPYKFFLNRNAAKLGASVLSEVDQVIVNMVEPIIDGTAKAILCATIVGLLLFADPMLALIVAIVLTGAYAVVYLLIRRRLSAIGAQRLAANRQRFRIASEAFGGVKEAKVLGVEDSFVDRFAVAADASRQAVAQQQILVQVPRYILEVIGFGGTIVVTLSLLTSGNEFSSILPLLGLYAFAGYRLMPAMQAAFNGLSRCRYGFPAFRKLMSDFDRIVAVPASETGNARLQVMPMPVRRGLALSSVRFTYPGAATPVLDGFDLTIRAGTAVGLVGATGAGKSTVMDLMLGLLAPDSGEFQVDGVRIDASNVRSWQRAVGYVPQHIFLSDASIAANVAFGVPGAEIDMDAVRRAVEIAQVRTFIETELPEGYRTVVGDRGIRLSGGQRQRLGIARALYRDPPVLFLDEATSALDGETERAFMDALYRAVRRDGEPRTIVMIAHRLTTLDGCDEIVDMGHAGAMTRGRVVADSRRSPAPQAAE